MKVPGKTVCLLTLSLLAISLNAQENQTLRGRVLNGGGEAVAGAVVSCIALPDNSLVAYGVTDDDGSFLVAGVAEGGGGYLLEVSSLGYEKAYVRPASGETVITLRESATELDEARVTASARPSARISGSEGR